MPRDYYTKSFTDRLRVRSACIRKKFFYRIYYYFSCVIYNVNCSIDRSISNKCVEYFYNKRFCELIINLEELDRTIR